MPARAAGSGSPPATVTLLPENFRNCERGQLWLNSNELEAVRQAVAAQSSRLSLQWAVEPVWVSKADFLRRKNMKMADPSDEEEEKDATNGEGSASPISALSGSMRSHGHDLSHLRKDKDLTLKDRRALEKRKDRKDPSTAKGGRSNKPPLKPAKPPKRSKSDSDGSEGSDGNASDDDEDQDEDGAPGTVPMGPSTLKPSTDSKATPQDTPSVFQEGSKEDPKATYWNKKAHAKPEKFPKDSDKEADDKALESKPAKGEKRYSEDKDDLLKDMEMKGKKSKTAPGASKDDLSAEEVDAEKAQQQVEYLDSLRQRLSEPQRDQLANRFGQAMDLPQMDQETRRQLAWHMEDQLGVPRNQDLFDGWNDSPPAS